MRYRLLFTYLVLLWCHKSAAAGKANGVLNDSLPLPPVVFILHQAPVNGRSTGVDGRRIGSGPLYEIAYYIQQKLQVLVVPRYAPATDTVTIPATSEWVEVVHAYRGIDKLSILLRKGDTACITYNGLKPVVTLNNRKAGAYDLNFDMLVRQWVHKDAYPLWVQYKAAPLLVSRGE